MKKNPMTHELTIELQELGLLDDCTYIPRHLRNCMPENPSKQRVHSKKFLAERLDFSIPDKINVELIDWETRIEKLVKYFESINISMNSIDLNPYTTIYDIPGFIKSLMILIKTCNKNHVYLPYLERLEKLRELLQDYPTSKCIDHL